MKYSLKKATLVFLVISLLCNLYLIATKSGAGNYFVIVDPYRTKEFLKDVGGLNEIAARRISGLTFDQDKKLLVEFNSLNLIVNVYFCVKDEVGFYRFDKS